MWIPEVSTEIKLAESTDAYRHPLAEALSAYRCHCLPRGQEKHPVGGLYKAWLHTQIYIRCAYSCTHSTGPAATPSHPCKILRNASMGEFWTGARSYPFLTAWSARLFNPTARQHEHTVKGCFRPWVRHMHAKYVHSPTKSKALHAHFHAICALKHFLEPEDEKVNWYT